MNTLELTEYGAKMVELYYQMQAVRQSVYDTEVKNQIVPDDKDAAEDKRELHVEVWRAFDPLLDFMRGRILKDIESRLLDERE